MKFSRGKKFLGRGCDWIEVLVWIWLLLKGRLERGYRLERSCWIRNGLGFCFSRKRSVFAVWSRSIDLRWRKWCGKWNAKVQYVWVYFRGMRLLYLANRGNIVKDAVRWCSVDWSAINRSSALCRQLNWAFVWLHCVIRGIINEIWRCRIG